MYSGIDLFECIPFEINTESNSVYNHNFPDETKPLDVKLTPISSHIIVKYLNNIRIKNIRADTISDRQI